MKKNTQQNRGFQGSGDFGFRKLDVYRLMLDYLRLEHRVTRSFPSGSAPLRDQMDRAGDSMALNLAEGAGKKRGSRDRSRFYGIAAGSTSESASGWDIARIRGYVDQATADRAIGLLSRIKAMLERMKH